MKRRNPIARALRVVGRAQIIADKRRKMMPRFMGESDDGDAPGVSDAD